MTDTETSNRTRNAKLIGLALTTALAGVTLIGLRNVLSPHCHAFREQGRGGAGQGQA